MKEKASAEISKRFEANPMVFSNPMSTYRAAIKQSSESLNQDGLQHLNSQPRPVDLKVSKDQSTGIPSGPLELKNEKENKE
jgi:hypothetical protein